ncbi:MAG: hypothetical protein KC505_06475 [Myxococcales bacterium]|nr:hypothetical protein [Myxococcales bacterium]USN51050.1 MAG: hypothetical protein H6731_01170 [Myxococcales bacterium]
MLSQAPGKIMIAGEYSVLLGYPALVSAIDRYALCHFKKDHTTRLLSKTTKNFIEVKESDLFKAVTHTLKENNFLIPRGTYSLDTSSFFDGEQKIGFGSSAAAVVALSKNILLQNNIDDESKLLRLSHQAHKIFSGGVGSGADCAASVYEQTILYQLSSNQPHVKKLNFSSIWHDLKIIHTGKAQSTSPFVKKFLDINPSDEAIINFCNQSTKIIQSLLKNCYEPDKVINAFTQLFTLLDQLGQFVGIDIISKEHREIHRLAQLCNGSAKPSGAGGGDIAIAVIPQDQHHYFKKLLAQNNFSLLDINQTSFST